jgi:hypothetical protein
MTEPQKRERRRKARKQLNLALDPHIVAMIKKVASAEGVSASGVVDLFLSAAVSQYLNGQLEFDNHLQESRSPRLDWVVDIPNLDSLEERLDSVLFSENGKEP